MAIQDCELTDISTANEVVLRDFFGDKVVDELKTMGGWSSCHSHYLVADAILDALKDVRGCQKLVNVLLETLKMGGIPATRTRELTKRILKGVAKALRGHSTGLACRAVFQLKVKNELTYFRSTDF